MKKGLLGTFFETNMLGKSIQFFFSISLAFLIFFIKNCIHKNQKKYFDLTKKKIYIKNKKAGGTGNNCLFL